MLKLSSPRYVRIDGYPYLEVGVEGTTARIEPPRHPSFHEQGLVVLGDDFADLVPAARYVGEDGRESPIDGLARDARLFRLVDDFALAVGRGDFAEGPVPLPA